MSENNESAGAQLRRERERQGLTIQKVADDLRLDRAVVEAIEDDSYTQTVPAVYSKGHLRKYYRLLGLAIAADADAPAAERGATTPTPLAPPTSPARRGARAMRIAPRVTKLPWAKIGIAAAIIVILLLFWWSPWKHRVAVQPATAHALSHAAHSRG